MRSIPRHGPPWSLRARRRVPAPARPADAWQLAADRSEAPPRLLRVKAFGVVLVAAAGSLAVTACSTGASCSSTLVAPSDAAALAGGDGPAGGAGLNDPRGPIKVDRGGAPAAAQPASAIGTQPSNATVTLVTGDRVTVDMTPSGPAVTPTLAPATGTRSTGSSTFVRFNWGGDQYVIPDAAVPYVGSTLDLRLFDVSYLMRAGLDDAHAKSLPLQVSGDAAVVPGVHATGRSGGAESATLAKSTAPAFGRQLSSTWRRGGSSAELARIGSISLAPPTGAPQLPTLPASPSRLPTASSKKQHWHTITLKFIGSDGQPGTGIGWLQNVGDARLGTVLVNDPNLQGGATGPESFSVPDGTYSLQVSVLTPHPGSANRSDAALVVMPELEIDSDQTVVLDARTAVAYQSVVDPAVDSSVRLDEINVWRASTSGGGCSGLTTGSQYLGLFSASGPGYAASVIGATPTAKVTHGDLGFVAQSLLATGTASPAPLKDPRYYLVFPSEGAIPKSLRYTAPAEDLTTVHSDVYANRIPGCRDAAPELWPNVYFPWGGFQELRLTGVPINTTEVPPGQHTDYWYTSDTKLAAFESEAVYAGDTEQCFAGGLYGPRRTLSPGRQIHETWNQGPQVPTSTAWPNVGIDGQPPLPTSPQELSSRLAPATRQDDNGMLYLVGGDFDATHYWQASLNTHALTFTRDGEVAISSPFDPRTGVGSSPFGLDLPLLHRPATYTLDWTMEQYFLSPDPTSETVWTFHSSPSDPVAKMPAGEHCAPDTSRSCSFLPLMFLRYDLPLDFNQRVPAGKPLAIDFTVSGQQGAPSPRGVSATVSVSFDGGKTWTDPVGATSAGDNAFTATVDQPPLAQTNGSVYLKVHAADAHGNAVDQTTTPAYWLTDGEG